MKTEKKKIKDDAIYINETTKRHACPRCKKPVRITMSEGAAIAVLQFAGWNVKLRRPGHTIDAPKVEKYTPPRKVKK